MPDDRDDDTPAAQFERYLAREAGARPKKAPPSRVERVLIAVFLIGCAIVFYGVIGRAFLRWLGWW